MKDKWACTKCIKDKSLKISPPDLEKNSGAFAFWPGRCDFCWRTGTIKPVVNRRNPNGFNKKPDGTGY